jgi:hypothetical protein
MANRLCVHATGKTFIECGKEAESKIIQIYDFAAKKKVNKEFDQVFTNLIDKEVLAAILLQKENKRVQNAAGKYVNGAETVERNYLAQFFNPETGLTLTEIKNEIETPDFLNAWKKQNKDKIRNVVKEIDPSLSSNIADAVNDNPFS